ncbi:peroxiredoxin-like family protein [Curtobacterium pusillum]|uniref:peroxiredoxin-like family protein n=1 Tax=Curtobacterium pusillum TaxID=69373 RepID=UPI0011A3EB23|nr:peroxiredoxin-like family protein [Curtobacterium pusillum]
MPEPTLAEQVTTFNDGFTAQIGPDLTAVFDQEQAALRAAGVPDAAAGEGHRVPDAVLVTPVGAATSLAAELGPDLTVLVFYRGAWCPYCNLTLRTYQRDLLPELTARGARLIAISPQTPEGSEAAVANGELAFPVLSDPGNVLAAELGIVTEPNAAARQAHTQLGFDVADSNADDTAQVPFPSVFVVDGDRVIRFADVKVDYTIRTEVSAVLAAVDRAAA